jgi:calcineurin-like phosphoesterase family protein
MEHWFIGDTHFLHEAMLTMQHRPYPSVDEMGEDIVRRWNEVVKPGDIVRHVGDFAVGNAAAKERIKELFKRLNGEKMLIIGNHDDQNNFVLKLGWCWVGHKKVVKIDGQVIVLGHCPMQMWDESMNASWHLYGHVHGGLPEHQTCLKMDVGVDARGMRPISFGEVKEIMSKRTFVPPDRRQVYYEEDLIRGWTKVRA